MASARSGRELMPPVVSLKLRRRMADKFLHFRQRYKLTQIEFGRLIDLGKVEVIHIEKARRYPRHSTIDRFESLVRRYKAGRKLAREKASF